MNRSWFVGALLAGINALAGQATAEGDAARGEKLYNGFLKCYTCHSLEPGVNKVGPTLAGLYGRRAGTAEGFDRYTPAMKDSGVVWDASALDKFMADPQKFIPGNGMIMNGYYIVGQVSSAQYRADVIAYIEQAGGQ